jgi:aspartyl/glutamyl-tRNA(Asn/Gln) amidotransferase C subunit
MQIEDVENLALLSRIYLSEEEKKKLLKDMEGILDYVKQIENTKLENTEVDFPVYNISREDEVSARQDLASLMVEAKFR